AVMIAGVENREEVREVGLWAKTGRVSKDGWNYPRSTSVAEPILEPSTAPINGTLPDVEQLLVETPVLEPHIGFLKELGLDFGWGPTALVEYVLEHIHVYAGTPWWASIVLSLLAIRIAIFKTYVGGADTSARLMAIKPHIDEIRERVNQARVQQDMPEMMRRSQEMRDIYAATGIKIWKSFLPFVAVPLGYGMFRLTRNLAELPVPGLENGGFLWFTDLTLCDPSYLLPIGTGYFTFLVFKLGGEAGAGGPMNPTMKRLLKWVFPICSTVFTAWWPAVMQLSFFTTSIMALLQSYLFKQPWFRKFWRIQPLSPQNSPGAPTGPEPGYRGMVIPTTAREVPQESETSQGGVFGSVGSKFKANLANLQERGQKYVDKTQAKPTSRRSAAETKEAKRYDEKRRKEIEQSKLHGHGKKHPRR
ncbi:MAG: hypothetical protein Q9172_007061, partial [Xanthocarpia lactea]